MPKSKLSDQTSHFLCKGSQSENDKNHFYQKYLKYKMKYQILSNHQAGGKCPKSIYGDKITCRTGGAISITPSDPDNFFNWESSIQHFTGNTLDIMWDYKIACMKGGVLLMLNDQTEQPSLNLLVPSSETDHDGEITVNVSNIPIDGIEEGDLLEGILAIPNTKKVMLAIRLTTNEQYIYLLSFNNNNELIKTIKFRLDTLPGIHNTPDTRFRLTDISLLSNDDDGNVKVLMVGLKSPIIILEFKIYDESKRDTSDELIGLKKLDKPFVSQTMRFTVPCSIIVLPDGRLAVMETYSGYLYILTYNTGEDGTINYDDPRTKNELSLPIRDITHGLRVLPDNQLAIFNNSYDDTQGDIIKIYNLNLTSNTLSELDVPDQVKRILVEDQDEDEEDDIVSIITDDNDNVRVVFNNYIIKYTRPH